MGIISNMVFAHMGRVVGGDFNGKWVCVSADGKGKYNALRILHYFAKDKVYKKADVKNFSVMETGVRMSFGNQFKIGNKYKIETNDGKAFIIFVVSNDTGALESVFLL